MSLFTKKGRTPLLFAAVLVVAAVCLSGCGGDNGATPPDRPPTYKVDVLSAGTGAIGAGSYAAGATVTIYAGTPPAGQQFKNWTTTGAGVTLANANSVTTTFKMPANAVTATANFETQATTPTTYAVTVTGAGTGAAGAGSYAAGATVTISAGTPPTGQQFKNWTTTSAGVTLANANSATTTFTMPPNAVTVTANFETQTTTPTTYTVTVTSAGAGASGTGPYAAGTTVTISAGTPPAGQQFKNWTTTSAGVTLTDPNSAITTFTMPPNAVTVTAAFETATVTPSTYKVTVTSTGAAAIGQLGGGDYAVGATVTIFAGTVAAGTNLHFKNWGVTAGSGVTFTDQTSETTTFIMPANAVTVTAVFGIVAETGTFVDTRNNKTYKTATIGGKTWMAENLNYATGNSWCYNDMEANCDLYGRLYEGNTAEVACPSLWHLPTREEWDNLVTAIGGSSGSGTKLKATSGWTSGNGTDIYGFAGLPGGWRDKNGGYLNVGERGVWWTATHYSGLNAYSYWRRLMAGESNVSGGDTPRAENGFSIRCVQD